MTILEHQHRVRRALYRAYIAAIVVVLMALAAGVALHLYGRFCFARATAELEALLGEELVFDFSYLEKPRLPKEKNAAERLLDGARALDLSVSEWRLISEARNLGRHEWSSELEEDVRTLIGRNRAGLKILHEAAAIERSSFGINDYGVPEIFDLLAPDHRSDVARLLNVEGRLALADGDVDGGLAAAGAIARIATALQQEHHVICVVFALALERSLNRLVFEVVERKEPWLANPALLAELETVLPTWDWQQRANEFLVIDGSMSSVDLREDVSVPWPVRFLFGHLAGAEALIGTRKSIEMIPLPYGRAQDRFHAASGTPRGLVALHDVWRIREARVNLGREPWTSREALVTFGQMFAAVPRSTARDPSANSWGRLIGVYLKFQVIAAERQLLRAALALRRDGIVGGGYPPERPASAILAKPSPFTGQLIAYRLGDDGSLALELEGAEKLLAQRWGGRSWTNKRETRDLVNHQLREKVFAVTLPPPPAGGKRGYRADRQESASSGIRAGRAREMIGVGIGGYRNKAKSRPTSQIHGTRASYLPFEVAAWTTASQVCKRWLMGARDLNDIARSETISVLTNRRLLIDENCESCS